MVQRISEMQGRKIGKSSDFIESKKAAEVEADEDDFDSEFADTTVLKGKDDDDEGDIDFSEDSVEINVEQLLAEVEAEASRGVDSSVRVRRRLEAIMERKRRHQDLIDFEEYDLDI